MGANVGSKALLDGTELDCELGNSVGTTVVGSTVILRDGIKLDCDVGDSVGATADSVGNSVCMEDCDVGDSVGATFNSVGTNVGSVVFASVCKKGCDIGFV